MTLFVLTGEISVIFSQKKKKKKKIGGRPSGHYFGHPLDRKQTFFKGGLIIDKITDEGNVIKILFFSSLRLAAVRL